MGDGTIRTRLIALDLSLSSTGVACLDLTPQPLGPQDVTLATQRVTSKPPTPPARGQQPTLDQTSTRLRKLAGQITQLCVGADLVLVEGPSYGSSGAGTWDRAGLWWLVVGRLTGAGLQVVVIPPSSVKTYAVGKGNGPGTDKDHVLAAVVLRYQHLVTVTGNDEADAVVMAAMAARWIGQPIEDTLPKTHTRALSGVRWHHNPTR